MKFLFTMLIISFCTAAGSAALDEMSVAVFGPAITGIMSDPPVDYQESEKKEFNAKSGGLLEIDLNTGGSVNITGWDKEILQAEITPTGSCEDCTYKIKETSEGIEIVSSHEGRQRNHKGGFDFEIHLPRKFNIKMSTMGGAVVLNNIEGNLSGKTMGGELELKSLKGDLDLLTMGGDISLTASDVDGNVKTMGGDVLISDVKGDVNGSSMGGNVSLKNVTRRSGASTGSVVKISSMGGAINVDDAPAGADVNTMGGDINISSAAKFVKAKTMGGDITIRKAEGEVTATTMSGEIDTRIISASSSGEISLTTMNGDITLYVPDGFSMDIEIEVTYHDKEDASTRIESDFRLPDTNTEIKNNGNSEPYYKLISKGSVNGGKNKVTIKTLNGTVKLLRS